MGVVYRSQRHTTQHAEDHGVSGRETNIVLSSFLFLLLLATDSYRVELGGITQHNLKQLKRLNSVIFPISYSDKVRWEVTALLHVGFGPFLCVCEPTVHPIFKYTRSEGLQHVGGGYLHWSMNCLKIDPLPALVANELFSQFFKNWLLYLPHYDMDVERFLCFTFVAFNFSSTVMCWT